MSAAYYSDDFVSLYLGDCREVMPTLDASNIRCVVADPPYAETSLAWDVWPEGWVTAVERAVAPSASLWCFGSMRMHLARHPEFAAWRLAQDLVWEKHNGSNAQADRFRRVHECILHWYRGPWGEVFHTPVYTRDAVASRVIRRHRPQHWGDIGSHTFQSEEGGPRLARSVIAMRSEHGKAYNETQKPVALVSLLLQHTAPPASVVLDPFSGSGTTLLAAREIGLRVIGIEARESQCEVAANRLSQGLLL